MPLASNALTTYATARDVMGLGNDDPQASQDHVERLINSISQEMERAAGRPFARATVVRERYGTNGSPRLILQRTPIVSVSEVDVTGPDGTGVYEVISATSYYIEDATAGFLCRPSLWPTTWFLPMGISGVDVVLSDQAEKRIRVSYVGGYITPEQERVDAALPVPVGLVRDLPYDIEEACLASVSSALRRSGQDRNVSSESSATVSKSWRETTSILTPETLAVCHRYARYV